MSDKAKKDSAKKFTESLLGELEKSGGEGDGHFEVEYREGREGRAVLTVYPPASLKNKKVAVDDVLDRLNLLRVKGYERDQVEEIVLLADGKPYDVGQWGEGKPEDGSLELSLDSERMKAWVELFPPKFGGREVTKDQILRALESHGVRYGILQQKVEQVAQKPEYEQKHLVAQGDPPSSGQNGYIELLFETPQKVLLQEDEHGRVDFRNLDIIKSVAEGEAIAQKHSPGDGVAGRDIFNEVIPPSTGRSAEWLVGRNVYLNDDESRAFAAITGRPIMDEHGIISVDEIIHLEDVDYSTGNVNFPGTIIVEQRIADDFYLETKGSILVKKSVGKAYLKAGKDILLAGGFMGRDAGSMEAERDIYARFVERGRLQAGGSIFINEASMHSELVARNSILIQGGRGDLIGGQAIAGQSIACNRLGAVVETPTHVVAGTPPQLLTSLKQLKDSIREKEDVLFKVSQSLHHLDEKREQQKLDDEEKNMILKLEELEKRYTRQKDNEEEQLQSAVRTFDPEAGSFVFVLEQIYHKVEITFGQEHIFHSPIKPVSGPIYIFLQDNRIVQDHKPPRDSKIAHGSWQESVAEIEKQDSVSE